MKQILQDLKHGATFVEQVPCPRPGRGQVLIATTASLISAGTERMLVEFGKGNLLQKARQQPDKVRMVLDKVKTDGVLTTLDAVRNKLDQALPMGYCNVGEVIEVGEGVSLFKPGDRVASNGKHAERVVVAENLCAKIPDDVTDEEAAFTVLGAIALHGIRLAEPTLGERVVVVGLGLVGLLAVQILLANGCAVIGFDFDADRVALAKSFGAEAYVASDFNSNNNLVQCFTNYVGADVVIVAASTGSSEPMRDAIKFCRKKGRVVQVGLTGMELSRTDLFEKEVSVQVSCSYGPGRYDNLYEEKGLDYPISYVRWTEQRNFEAILDLLKRQRINAKVLISHRFSINQAEQAYALVDAATSSLGILLIFPDSRKPDSGVRTIILNSTSGVACAGNVGFLGAGNYALQILMPAFKAAAANMISVVSNTGVSSVSAAKKFGFSEASTDSEALLARNDIDTIVIATRHNSHAKYVCAALRAGKHVFVEKPLAINERELADIERAYSSNQLNGVSPLLMVGFNRRFSPHSQLVKKLLNTCASPKAFVYTINAGFIPAGHWTQATDEGGGRIIGECCHFIDLLRFFAGSPVDQVQAVSIPGSAGSAVDNVTITLTFSDGSIGTIHYLSNGHKSLAKERLEIFCDGKVIQLDNFRNMKLYGWKNRSSNSLWRQDKGNSACAEAFVSAVRRGSTAPIPFAELLEVSRITLKANELLQSDKQTKNQSDWF